MHYQNSPDCSVDRPLRHGLPAELLFWASSGVWVLSAPCLPCSSRMEQVGFCGQLNGYQAAVANGADGIRNSWTPVVQVYVSTGAGAMDALPTHNNRAHIAAMRTPLRAGDYDSALERAAMDIGLSLAGGEGPRAATRTRAGSWRLAARDLCGVCGALGLDRPSKAAPALTSTSQSLLAPPQNCGCQSGSVLQGLTLRPSEVARCRGR